MQIQVLLFGIVKDIVGGKTLNLEVNDNCNVGTLKKTLLEKFPHFEELKYLGVAVNNEYATNDTPIRKNDEIALIPPVSGG